MSGTTTRRGSRAAHTVAHGAGTGTLPGTAPGAAPDPSADPVPDAVPAPRPRAHPAPRPAHTAVNQLHSARMSLAEAADATSPGVRYVCAHLAALRAAAAVLTAREPVEPRKRGRPRSVWVLLPEADPALREWAAFFAAGADKRAAAEAGLPRAVTAREAEELMRDADVFVTLVEDTLGIPSQPTLPAPDQDHPTP
ncbi:SAV_6107 family HEPN domain-containing protein [Actinomadura flavalba]|uniref:SAV_6107 family HEPN domain-containing protein n=1 Tax=Actinomadura flavalba TaxID=1120938 RepID=UPI000361A5F2|nr:SAV_6107 family HEPN domain-containing protein [Actinomadura flavalba]